MKIKQAHAAGRLAVRYDGYVSMEDLKGVVAAGDFEFLKRQSVTRSLCKCIINGHDVYFILNRKLYSIVTVLTPEQADEWL